MEPPKELSKTHIGLPLALVLLYISFAMSILIESYWHYEPSNLCLAQRHCMAVCITCVTIAFLSSTASFYKKVMDFSCLLLFLGALLSCYQLLSQYHIIDESEFCKSSIPTNVSIQELEEIIRHNEITSCANLGFTIFGIPISAFNFVMFIFLLVYFSICSLKSSGEANEQ
jgi:disulfide bond formation protein DsbB